MYNFNNASVNVQSIIHVINITQKDNLVGIELGVQHGHSLCTLAQRINNLNMVYGIDPYLPYTDYLKEHYDGEPAVLHTEEMADLYRINTYHNIKFSGKQNKIQVIEEKSEQAVYKFEDNSLDFIFIDSHSTPQELYVEMTRWYSKIKKGGVFAGHDVYYATVENSVNKFRKDNDISNNMSIFDNVFVWLK